MRISIGNKSMKKKTTTTNLFKISKTIKIHLTISKLKKIRLKIALKELVFSQKKRNSNEHYSKESAHSEIRDV